MNKTYTKQDILDFLRKTALMSIAVIAENKPLSSVVLFAIDDDFTMYFVTHRGSYKATALQANPAISISVWQNSQMSVQANGQATEIDGVEEMERAIEKISISANHLKDFWPPLLQINNKSAYLAFAIKLDWLRALDLSYDTITVKELLFNEIEV